MQPIHRPLPQDIIYTIFDFFDAQTLKSAALVGVDFRIAAQIRLFSSIIVSVKAWSKDPYQELEDGLSIVLRPEISLIVRKLKVDIGAHFDEFQVVYAVSKLVEALEGAQRLAQLSIRAVSHHMDIATALSNNSTICPNLREFETDITFGLDGFLKSHHGITTIVTLPSCGSPFYPLSDPLPLLSTVFLMNAYQSSIIQGCPISKIHICLVDPVEEIPIFVDSIIKSTAQITEFALYVATKRRVSSLAYSIIAHLPSLRTLRVGDDLNLTPSRFALMDALDKLTSLEVLEWEGYHARACNDAESFVSACRMHCPSLRRVVLSAEGGFGIKSLQEPRRIYYEAVY